MKSQQEKCPYQHLTWRQVKQIDKEDAVIILPIGSFEQHGPHLPLITDTKLAVETCNLVSREVPDTYVLPPIAYCHSPSLTGFPGTISLRPETIYALLSDVIVNLQRDGFKRIVLFNAHGGNHKILTDWIAGLNGSFSNLLINYIFLGDFGIDVIEEIKETEAWGHACEMETSMCLSLFPELVRMQNAILSPPQETKTDPKIDPKRYWLERHPHGSIGDPSKATKAKGDRILNAILEGLIARIADIKEH